MARTNTTPTAQIFLLSGAIDHARYSTYRFYQQRHQVFDESTRAWIDLTSDLFLDVITPALPSDDLRECLVGADAPPPIVEVSTGENSLSIGADEFSDAGADDAD